MRYTYVRQHDSTDCAAASLAMVCLHYKKEITITRLRDMMGTDSNTLILAFAGGSISMLVLDYAYNLPYRQIINSNNIGIAIMQGLSGSFGIVLAVPVTVALAVLLYTWRKAAPAA